MRGVVVACAIAAIVTTGVVVFARWGGRVWTDGRFIREDSAAVQVRDVLWEPPRDMPPHINTSADDYEARVSADGSTLFFVRGRAGGAADIFSAERTGPGSWGPATPFAAANSPADDLGPTPSSDGRALYFYSDRVGGVGGYDLWVTRRTAAGWQTAVNLGTQVNSPFNDYGPALDVDSGHLYFASNRPKHIPPGAPLDVWQATLREDNSGNDYDLYVAELNQQDIGVARRMASINTSANEGAPALSPAGDFMYFSSDRAGGAGGFDLYRVRLTGPGSRSVENLGPTLNTAANEMDPALIMGGFGLLFSSNRGVPAPGAEAPDYNIYFSQSREVFGEIQSRTINWGHMWAQIGPQLMWLLLALLLLALMAAMMHSGMYGRLGLLARCVLASLFLHLLLLLLLSFWKVGAVLADVWRDGHGVHVTLASAPSDGSLTRQVIGNLTDVGAPAGEAVAAPPQSEDVAVQAVTEMVLLAAVSASDRPAPTTEVGVPMREAELAPPVVTEPDLHTAAPVPAPELAMPEPARAAVRDEPRLLAAVLPVETVPDPIQPTASTLATATAPVALTPAQRSVEPSSLLQPAAAPAPVVERPIDHDPVDHLAAVPDLEDPSEWAAALPVLEEATAAPSDETDPSGAVTAPTALHRADGATVDIAPALQAAAPISAAPSQMAAAVTAPLAAVTVPSESVPPTAVDYPPPLSPVVPVPLDPVATTTDMPVADAIAIDAAGDSAEPRATALAATPIPFEPTVVPDVSAAVVVVIDPSAVASPLAGAAVPLPAAPVSNELAELAPAAPMASMPGLPDIALAMDLPAVEESAADVAVPDQAEQPVALPLQPQLATILDSGWQPPASTFSLTALSPTAIAVPEAVLAPADIPELEVDVPSTSWRLEVPPVDIPLEPPPPFELPTETELPDAYAGRTAVARRELVERMGGSADTEAAVDRALIWLAAHQSADGRWDADGFDDGCGACGGTTQIEADLALTGLSVLCFLAADHTHTNGSPYRNNVRSALYWIVGQQSGDGDLRMGESMYSHGIGTIALAEAYGMTADEGLRGAVGRAVGFIHRARNRTAGGWRYDPGQPGDTSVLGWQIMALKSAERAGIEVPDGSFENARQWLSRVSHPASPGRFAYRPGQRPSPAMTAEGVFVWQLLGADRNDRRMTHAVEYLLDNPPSWSHEPNTYYWYYATLALYQHQGEPWRVWNEAMTAALLPSQIVDGAAAGSWDPIDRWAKVGGRVYQTALCTLMLESYYRYLPMYSVVE